MFNPKTEYFGHKSPIYAKKEHLPQGKLPPQEKSIENIMAQNKGAIEFIVMNDKSNV